MTVFRSRYPSENLHLTGYSARFRLATNSQLRYGKVEVSDYRSFASMTIIRKRLQPARDSAGGNLWI